MAFLIFVQQVGTGTEQATKHKGYEVLESWQRKGIIQQIITQNVDGFHHEALEYHGTLANYYCEECDTPATKQDFIDNAVCPVCKLDLMIRPDMVLYGERIHPEIEKKSEELIKRADLLIVMGTSLEVKPFAGLVDLYLQEHQAKNPLWIINKTTTPYTRFAHYQSDESITEWLQKMDAYM